MKKRVRESRVRESRVKSEGVGAGFPRPEGRSRRETQYIAVAIMVRTFLVLAVDSF